MQELMPADIAIVIEQTLRGDMAKRQLGQWAHRAMLNDDARTTPLNWKHRSELSHILHKLMLLDEMVEPGEYWDISDAELAELVRELERLQS